MDAFERQIADVVRQTTRAPRQVDGLAIARSVSSPPVRWRLSSTLGATRVAVAGVVVALLGILVVAGPLTRWTDDAPPASGATAPPTATARTVELPATIPEGVDGGTLETPLGQARWVHLRGDADSLPSDLGGVIATSDGYVKLESDVDSSSPRLWRSPDLVSWAWEPLGIEVGAASLVASGGAYWLIDHEHGGLWRSPDLETWQQLDLDGLARPGPDGYAWTFQPSGVVSFQGTTLVPFRWIADHHRLTEGLPVAEGLTRPELHRTESGVYGLYELGGSDGPAHAYLRFEQAGGGVRIVDAQDGTELAFHEDISLEFVERVLSGTGIPSVLGQARVEGGMLVEAGAWGDAVAPREEEALTADDAGLVRYTLEPDGLVHVSRSQDGRAWTETDVIGDGPGEPSGIRSLHAWGGTVRLYDDDAPWVTTDDGRWERQPDPEHSSSLRLGSGWLESLAEAWTWIETDVPLTSVRYWPDGGAPLPLDVTELGLHGGCSGGEGLVSGNTLASFYPEQCQGAREIWILTFDDLPA